MPRCRLCIIFNPSCLFFFCFRLRERGTINFKSSKLIFQPEWKSCWSLYSLCRGIGGIMGMGYHLHETQSVTSDLGPCFSTLGFIFISLALSRSPCQLTSPTNASQSIRSWQIVLAKISETPHKLITWAWFGDADDMNATWAVGLSNLTF